MAVFSKNELKVGAMWSFVSKFGGIIITLINTMIMSRMLTPVEYGVFGVVFVFVNISNVLVEGGFSSALIQKKEINEIDYSAVFYFNTIMSLLLYAILFFSSGYVAEFVRIENIESLIKVVGLTLLVNALCIVQRTKLQRKIDYKKIAVVEITANILGSTVGIYMASEGYGVWSLVVFQLVVSTVCCIIFYILGRWRPLLVFSLSALKDLLNFGGIMMLASLVEVAYVSIIPLIIGNRFSVRDVGIYNQAQRLQEVPDRTLIGVFNSINFPYFASFQDNIVEIKRLIRINIKLASFISAGLMMMLVVMAEDIIVLLFSDRWVDSVLYFQILCSPVAFYLTNAICANMVKALGKAKVYFFLQLSKRVIGIISILIAVQFGLKTLVWVVALQSVIWGFLNIIVTRRLIDYRAKEYLSDIYQSIGLSLFCAAITYSIVSNIDLPSVVAIILTVVVYGSLYLGIACKLNLLAWRILYDNILVDVVKKIKIW